MIWISSCGAISGSGTCRSSSSNWSSGGERGGESPDGVGSCVVVDWVLELAADDDLTLGGRITPLHEVRSRLM